MRSQRKMKTEKSERKAVLAYLILRIPYFIYLFIRIYGGFVRRKRSYLRKFRKTVMKSSISRDTAENIVQIQKVMMKYGFRQLIGAFLRSR